MGTLVHTLASSPSSLSTYAAGLATHEGEAHAATGVTAYAWLLVALPLLGAAVLLLGGRRTDKFGPVLATADGFKDVERHMEREIEEGRSK